MKKIIFVLPLLAMIFTGCSNPTNGSTKDNVEGKTPVTTPDNGANKTPASELEDKSPFEYVKPDCVDLEADYTYVGDYIFADSMNFAEWKYSNAETNYTLAFEKIARVKNENPDTQMVRWDHYTYEEIIVEKATKYKVYVKTYNVNNPESINNSTNPIFHANILSIGIIVNKQGLSETYDGTSLSIIQENDLSFTMTGFWNYVNISKNFVSEYIEY